MRCEPIATSVGTSSGFAICLFSFATGAGAVARSRVNEGAVEGGSNAGYTDSASI